MEYDYISLFLLERIKNNLKKRKQARILKIASDTIRYLIYAIRYITSTYKFDFGKVEEIDLDFFFYYYSTDTRRP